MGAAERLLGILGEGMESGAPETVGRMSMGAKASRLRRRNLPLAILGFNWFCMHQMIPKKVFGCHKDSHANEFHLGMIDVRFHPTTPEVCIKSVTKTYINWKKKIQ